jgi:enoyl-CoA hydratase/carnithine racemase
MPVLTNEIEPGIVSVVMSNPARRNALDHEMFLALAELWPRLAGDVTVRVVLLSGAGNAFSAGADLSSHLDRLPGIDDLIDRALLKTGYFPKPMVAAIAGACVAGGLEIALAADVRIAADDAVLGLPEVRWGIMPSGGGAMKLVDQIGYARAMDLLLTGRLISGTAAERVGLVSKACPGAELWQRAIARARTIAGNSVVAVQAAKRAAVAPRCDRYRMAEAAERELVATVRRSGDPERGKSAFLTGGRPDFRDG